MLRTPRLLPIMATLVLVASACSSSTSSAAPGSVQPTAKNTFNPVVLPTSAAQTFHIPDFQPAALRWYCCLGTGEDPAQKPTEDKVAADFAKKYPGSSLKLEITTYNAAVDTLSTQIGPNPPDIAGPVGIGGLASFKGQWADLAPYLTSSAYDLSVYDPATVDFFKQDGLQIGVPFDLYPSMLWYKRDAFDEAGPGRAAARVRRQVQADRRHRGRVELRHAPPARDEADGRQERQGRHGGGLRPDQDRAVGLRAAARRARGHGRLLGRRLARRVGRQDRDDPGCLEGGLEVHL